MIEHNHIIHSAETSGQDRIKLLDYGERTVIPIADGAGDRSGGSEAADIALELMVNQAAALTSRSDCERLLRKVDAAIASDKIAGETTAVIVVVSEVALFGARVGDSGARVVNKEAVDDLTQGQMRKPFLGTGGAFVVGFRRDKFQGTLLVATEGLLKYASRETIAAVV